MDKHYLRTDIHTWRFLKHNKLNTLKTRKKIEWWKENPQNAQNEDDRIQDKICKVAEDELLGKPRSTPAGEHFVLDSGT